MSRRARPDGQPSQTRGDVLALTRQGAEPTSHLDIGSNPDKSAQVLARRADSLSVGLLDSTQLALQSAMSGSMLRQNVLTNDLANADTPNFQPEDVDFQSTLQQAMSSGQSPTSVSYTPYTQDQTTSADGNGVSTDQTETDISENALLYEELAQISSARQQIMQSAISTTA